MDRKIIRVCDRIIWIGLLTLAIAIPPLISLKMEDVIELPKITLFRIVILTMSIAWIIKWIERGNLNFRQHSTKGPKALNSWLRNSPLNLPVLAFLVISVISTLVSVDMRTSLVGVYKFYFWGLFSVIGYTLLYFLLIDNFAENRIGTLLKAMLLGSFPVAIYGLCQRLGLEFLNWAGGPSRERIWSTLGNPDFLGGYLIMVIPLGLSLLVSPRCPRNTRGILSKLLLVLLSGLLVSCVVYTLSRGAWLGLLACSVIWTISIGKNSIKRNRKWLIIALAVCVLFPAVFSGEWNIKSPLPESRKEEIETVMGRAISITDLREVSISARIETWKSTLRMIRKRPLLGWGLDNFGTIFPQFITPEFVRSAGRDMLQAHAHNEFLQVGATMGIVGLIVYVWLIITFFKSLMRLIKKERGDNRVFLVGILSSGVALMVYNQFHFSVVSTSIIFWLFMGVVGRLSKETGRQKFSLSSERLLNESEETSGHVQNNFMVFGILGIIYIFLSFLFLRPLIADIYAKIGQYYIGGDKAISSLEKAVKLNPWIELYRVNLANAYKERAEVTNSREEKEEYIEEAIRQSKETIELFPLSPFAYRNLGIAYRWKTQILGEPNTELALNEIEKALRIFPYFISALEDAGKVYFFRNELAKSCFYLNEALKIFPQDLAMRTILGAIYFKMGEKEKALEEWKKVWEIDHEYEGIKKYLAVRKGDQND